MAPPHYSETLYAGLDLGAGRFKGYYASKVEAERHSGPSPARVFLHTPSPSVRPPRFGRRAAAEPIGIALPPLPSPPKQLPIPLPPFNTHLGAADLVERQQQHLKRDPLRDLSLSRQSARACGMASAASSLPKKEVDDADRVSSESAEALLKDLYSSSPDPTGLFLRRKFGRREGFGRRRHPGM